MTRRDFFVDALYDAFELRPVSRVGIWDGCTAYDAYTKLGPREEKSALSETRLMSFVYVSPLLVRAYTILIGLQCAYGRDVCLGTSPPSSLILK